MPNKIDLSSTTDVKSNGDFEWDTPSFDMYHTNGRDLKSLFFSGISLSGHIRMDYWRWHRETKIEINKLMGIESSNVAYNSLQSGFFGIAPWT